MQGLHRELHKAFQPPPQVACAILRWWEIRRLSGQDSLDLDGILRAEAERIQLFSGSVRPIN